MNETLIDKIADAVLYEGYVLYPYRPAVKNRQRWTFGGLFPSSYCESQNNGDAWRMQIECLVRGDSETILNVRVRFLHLVNRAVGSKDDKDAALQFVDSLEVDDQVHQSWQEAIERDVMLESWRLGDGPVRRAFAWDSNTSREPIRDAAGNLAGFMVREQRALAASVTLSAILVASGVYKIRVDTVNQTFLDAAPKTRDEAAMYSMASTHAILGVEAGEFSSLIDPPADLGAFASQCINIGAWPVLAGAAGQRNTLLAAPIILYDYPQIAAASPGDLFDGTEIDEILSLRIATLTDEERRRAAGLDDRVRELLARTESLDHGQLEALHGLMRPAAPATNEETA